MGTHLACGHPTQRTRAQPSHAASVTAVSAGCQLWEGLGSVATVLNVETGSTILAMSNGGAVLARVWSSCSSTALHRHTISPHSPVAFACDMQQCRCYHPSCMSCGFSPCCLYGDTCAAAERIGVFAEPEVVTKQLTNNHPFIVLASDGVWEFLPSQSVVDMVRAQL